MTTPNLVGSPELDRAEATYTRSEALSRGLYVAEWFDGDTLIASYGHTSVEARQRLVEQFVAEVVVRSPDGAA